MGVPHFHHKNPEGLRILPYGGSYMPGSFRSSTTAWCTLSTRGLCRDIITVKKWFCDNRLHSDVHLFWNIWTNTAINTTPKQQTLEMVWKWLWKWLLAMRQCSRFLLLIQAFTDTCRFFHFYPTAVFDAQGKCKCCLYECWWWLCRHSQTHKSAWFSTFDVWWRENLRLTKCNGTVTANLCWWDSVLWDTRWHYSAHK